MLQIKLSKDLRKNILRGHPWLYADALDRVPPKAEVQVCRVLDKKGERLAWGFYCPDSPLRVRILSVDGQTPGIALYEKRLHEALEVRSALLRSATNCYRLINGEGDRLPGFVCDIYHNVAVMQFDGENCHQFWDQDFLAAWLLSNVPELDSVYFKPRASDSLKPQWWGVERDNPVVSVQENGLHFLVNIVEGQKTGFFLDQRENRLSLRNFSKGKRVLNLFSYSGGFSVYAGSAGARHVTSVDLAPEAIRLANENWLANELSNDQHSGVVADVFQFIQESREFWDLVVVDPPSMTHSERNKAKASESYKQLFAQAARRVTPGQHLVLSSCSSHISYEDFFEIINESLSLARRQGQILQVKGQSFDHPFPHFGQELRYLKFVHIKLN